MPLGPTSWKDVVGLTWGEAPHVLTVGVGGCAALPLGPTSRKDVVGLAWTEPAAPRPSLSSHLIRSRVSASRVTLWVLPKSMPGK